MLSDNLIRKSDLFADNYVVLKNNFKWDYSMMQRLGALQYANAGVEVNVQEIKQAKEIIKRNTGFFSAFHDTTYFALSILLSLEPNPEELFKQTVKVYNTMKEAGFHSSVYLTLAAFSIAKQTEEDNVLSVINRAKEFYDAMKKEHRFLTSADDYGYAAMLATTDLSVDQAIREMETCYNLLKRDFGSGNILQSLTHVLTIGDESATTKCDRAVKIYQKLNEKGCKLSKYSELATLGILVLITQDVDKITNEIMEVYEHLATKKGLGKWSITKQERTMFAAALSADDYINKIKNNPLAMTLTNNITNIVIAQQTAAIIAASSASAAAASSASS